MLGKRLQTANKKAAKRWLHYHQDSILGGPIGFGIGVYRKRKGCECRQCTRRNQERQHRSNKAQRRSKTVTI